MNKAIFLDRDGVITELIFNKERKEYEPPHKIGELRIIENSINALRSFQKRGFKLFLISNQPDYAKGKTTLESLVEVQNEFHKIMNENKIFFSEYFYCYHHPNGIVPEYSIDCECRKPKTYFVLKAIRKFDIDKNISWFIGDRDTDILCGKNSGLKTILINNNFYKNSENLDPDFTVLNIDGASKIILTEAK